MEILLELIGELVFQVVIELLLMLLSGTLRALEYFAVIPFALAGAVLGGASLWYEPLPFLDEPSLRWAALAVTPLVSGAVLGLVALRQRRDDEAVVPGAWFASGAVFTLAYMVVRVVAFWHVR